MKPKLVRDRIPEMIRANGENPIVHIADDKEYYDSLKSKLLEEVNEFLDDEEIKELADVIEVILAICDYNNIGFDEIEKIRQQKLIERGSFSKRIILDDVE